MSDSLNFAEARAAIRKGIEDKITFEELRKELPKWRKRPLCSLIFDVMAEMNLKHVPFTGLLVRPRLVRKPIQISSDGNLCIQELLTEKGYMGTNCLAYAHIGNNKITLTIKPKKKPKKAENPEISETTADIASVPNADTIPDMAEFFDISI